MGQMHHRIITSAQYDLIDRSNQSSSSSKGLETQGKSVPQCVRCWHRVGSTDDGNARRGVGRPSLGPLPRLPLGWSVPWPRQDTPCGAADFKPKPEIIRHRRPLCEEGRSYNKYDFSQGAFAAFSDLIFTVLIQASSPKWQE